MYMIEEPPKALSSLHEPRCEMLRVYAQLSTSLAQVNSGSGKPSSDYSSERDYTPVTITTNRSVGNVYTQGFSWRVSFVAYGKSCGNHAAVGNFAAAVNGTCNVKAALSPCPEVVNPSGRVCSSNFSFEKYCDACRHQDTEDLVHEGFELVPKFLAGEVRRGRVKSDKSCAVWFERHRCEGVGHQLDFHTCAYNHVELWIFQKELVRNGNGTGTVHPAHVGWPRKQFGTYESQLASESIVETYPTVLSRTPMERIVGCSLKCAGSLSYLERFGS
ncbi:hypothetical protein C8R43DRAFT_957342 [Mycena crocata]|nr:hypothetical protein C8R43DRAFT_957342 [Mycena crocata]